MIAIRNPSEKHQARFSRRKKVELVCLCGLCSNKVVLMIAILEAHWKII